MLYVPKQKKSISMIRQIEDIVVTPNEEHRDFSQTPNIKAFVYDSLKHPIRETETKLKNGLLCQTVTDFKNKFHYEPLSTKNQNKNEIFKKAEPDLRDYREDIIQTLDHLSGAGAIQEQKNNAEQSSSTKKIKFQGVSRRFNQNCNIDNQTSFSFVGPVSTKTEKMLKMRANLLANEKGLINHGTSKEQPSKIFMKKL